MGIAKQGPAFEPYDDDGELPTELQVDETSTLTSNTQLRLISYYLSRNRVLEQLDIAHLPAHVLLALSGADVAMSSAILSNIAGTYIIDAIRAGAVQTLPLLAFSNNLKPGTPFIYEGHVFGKGFTLRNKSPHRSLREKLDEPLNGRELLIEFSTNGLVNDTASSRLSGPVAHIFIYGYITESSPEIIRAIPYVIGDLVERTSNFPRPFLPSLELRPEEIAQFSAIDTEWSPTRAEFERMRQVPEKVVKELICRLLGEYDVPSDWGGEESDVFSANLLVRGQRHTGAFLLKGPSKFHPMKPTDLGANGDQLYRLFNIPAQVYIVQHCHMIGAAVRKQAEAFALARSFVSPCRFVFMDGITTARLLRAHGEWPKASRQKTSRTKVD